MDTNQNIDPLIDLKGKIENIEFELTKLKQSATSNNNDKTLEIIVEKGVPILQEHLKSTHDLKTSLLKNELELEKEEMKVIERLDLKEKIYKGILIAICLTALVISAIYIPKSEVIIPIISLVIGLLFRSSSLSDFLRHSKSKFSNSEDSE